MTRKNSNRSGNFSGISQGRSVSNGPSKSIQRTHNGMPTLTSLLTKVVGKRPASINAIADRLYDRFGIFTTSYNSIRSALLRHPSEFRLVEGNGRSISFRKA